MGEINHDNSVGAIIMIKFGSIFSAQYTGKKLTHADLTTKTNGRVFDIYQKQTLLLKS